jgi:FG-GAP-like repeat
MRTTPVLVAASCSLFVVFNAAAFAQSPSFIRSDMATGLSLTDRVIPGDFNSDGIPDLLVSARSLAEPFGIYLLSGNGDGTVAPPFLAFSAPFATSLGAADVNRDGTLDVLFLSVDLELWVLPGNGDGTFMTLMRSAVGVASGRPPLIADLNGDGNVDVVWAAQDSGISVALGNGNGSFRRSSSFPIGGSGVAAGLAAADVNRDGRIDLVAANLGVPENFDRSTVSVLPGHGDGTFGAATEFPVGAMPLTVVAADFNLDGNVDLAANNYAASSLSVLLGQGDGTFLPKTDYPIGPFTIATATADFNGDTRLDLAVCGPIAVLSILAGRGDGTFATRQDLPTAEDDCASIAIGDFNLDGRPDIGLNYFAGSGTLSIFLNTTAPRDAIPPRVTVAARPTVLWPPNGKTISVVVSGMVTDAGSGVDPTSVRFAVRDQYRRVQPTGGVSIAADGHYAAVVPLVASRRGDDRDGRTYTIVVSAHDRAGNPGSARIVVIVPHDHRAVSPRGRH